MRRFALALAAVALTVVAASALAADDDKDEWKKLNGTWIAAEGEAGGQPLPADNIPKLTLIMKDGTYEVKTADVNDKGKLKVDPKQKPKHVDIEGVDGPNAGKVFKAIYEIDGDKLKVCYDLGGGDRPKAFKTSAGSSEFLLVFKREKK